MIAQTLMLSSALLLLSSSLLGFAQDAVKVDPAHHKVEFENDQVRVLRIRFGPGEESVMHEHPCLIAIGLSDYLALHGSTKRNCWAERGGELSTVLQGSLSSGRDVVSISQ